MENNNVEVLEANSQAITPTSRDEYLDRRAQLWSLVQAADPERVNMEEIAAEWAALEAYKHEHGM